MTAPPDLPVCHHVRTALNERGFQADLRTPTFIRSGTQGFIYGIVIDEETKWVQFGLVLSASSDEAHAWRPDVLNDFNATYRFGKVYSQVDDQTGETNLFLSMDAFLPPDDAGVARLLMLEYIAAWERAVISFAKTLRERQDAPAPALRAEVPAQVEG